MKDLILLIAILFSSTLLLAQTVTYDESATPRPISITGLNVNGTIYDVVIVYDVPIDGTTLSGISASETDAACDVLINAMNAVNDVSGTIFR